MYWLPLLQIDFNGLGPFSLAQTPVDCVTGGSARLVSSKRERPFESAADQNELSKLPMRGIG